MPISSSCCGCTCTKVCSRRRSEVESSPSARGINSNSAHRFEAQRGLQLEMREEHAVIGRDRQPEDGGGRVQSEEHQGVVAAVLALEVIDQRGDPRAAPAHPVELLRPRVRFGQKPRGEARHCRRIGVAFGDRKAADAHTADAVRSLGVLVLPCARITRATREHVDVVAMADVLRQQTAGVLGPGDEVGPVARGHEREFHAVSLFPLSRTGPRGAASTTAAPGRAVRARAASHPGSGSIRSAGSPAARRSNMSR